MPPPAVLVPYLSSSLGAGVAELDMFDAQRDFD